MSEDESFVVEVPHRQDRVQRIVSAVLTFILWAVWTYLWLPLIPYVDALRGIDTPYQDFVLHGWHSLAGVLPYYIFVIFIIGCTLIGWATYNFIRFRNVERRGSRPDVDIAALASHFEIEPDVVSRVHASRRLTVAHDQAGRVASAEFDGGSVWIRDAGAVPPDRRLWGFSSGAIGKGPIAPVTAGAPNSQVNPI